MQRRGISLTEVVVVLSIVAVMTAIGLPAVQHVRESARRVVCQNNIKEISLALTQFSEINDGIRLPSPNDQTVGGWVFDALPFIDQNLTDALPAGADLDQVHEQFFRLPLVFQCPTQLSIRDANSNSIAAAHYVLGSSRAHLLSLSSANGRRKYRGPVAEAPLSLSAPWLNSPELFGEFRGPNDGPHSGGYYQERGHAVIFLDNN